jgi:hypothetical protein
VAVVPNFDPHGPATTTKPGTVPFSLSNLGPVPTGTLAPGAVPQAPPVPGTQGGSGQTVVSTPSLDAFAASVGQLISPVQTALSQLKALAPVAPGAFDKAWTIQGQVSGSQTGSGSSTPALQATYETVLTDLINGLTDLQSAVVTMSGKYTTADDLNHATATDLQNDLDAAQGDFGNMMTANGGSSGSAPAGAPAGPPATGGPKAAPG